MLFSDLRNEDPELAERIADGLKLILYLGDLGKPVTTTPTTMDSREIAASVGVDLKDTIYYERAEANGGPDAKSVLCYPDGLLAIELLDVS